MHAVQTEEDAIMLAKRFPPEPLSDDSLPRQYEFLERFDAFASGCCSPATAAFASFFNALFWTGRSKEYRILDLGIGEDKIPYGPESAWNPTTVVRYADLWGDVSLEEFRGVFKPAKGNHVAFTSFEEFKDYAEEWGDIVRRGAKRGRGLITFTWG
jgi:hypothetical protein